MSYVSINVNPANNRVGDCVVRAISVATEKSWDDVYTDLSAYGFVMKDMPSSNAVWGQYLRDNGWQKGIVNESCPDCYTVKDFCEDHNEGVFVLGTGTHAVAVKNGNYFDSFDSGDEVIAYFWRA